MTSTRPRSHLTVDGIKLGLKLALILSLLYIFLILVITFSDRTFTSGMPFTFYVSFSGSILGIGVVFGGIPAVVIGVITGGLIAFIIERSQSKLSRVTALMLGLFISVGIATAINIPLLPKNPDQVYMYRTYLAIPSIIYVMAGGYAGLRLYIKNSKTADESPSANISPDPAG
jgi:hypothetical protein